ncbi:MAG: DUF4190 domain-containing protein [Actinomycetota bacterium]
MASDGRWYPPAAWPPYPVMQPTSGPGWQAPPGPPGYGAPSSTPSGMSIASMVLGILPVIPVLGSMAAIILGAVARAQIRRSAGRQSGKGMALAGILLGSTWLAGITAIIVVAAVVGHNAQPSGGGSIALPYTGASSSATASTARRPGRHRGPRSPRPVPRRL